MQSAPKPSPSGVGRYLIPDLPSTDEILPYLRQIDAARWYSNFGPLVCEFEERLRAVLAQRDQIPERGPIHLTSLVSGYHALEIGLRLFGIGPRKTVLLPAVTFPACPLAIQNAGAEPVLADIDPVNWTLTPQIARAVVAKTRIDAVMPVAVYGVPLPATQWDDFSRETGIPVIIDAAAAVEVQDIPRFCLVAHSLHATKPFGVGEGGLLVSRDDTVIDRARHYSNFGTTERLTYAEGANAKMSEYHAAVGLAQISRWTAIKQKRAALTRKYRRRLQSLTDFLSFQPQIETAVVSSFMLMLKKPVANDILEVGLTAGVATHRTYLPPLYRHPHFANLPLVDVNGNPARSSAIAERGYPCMVNSEDLFDSLVGIPFHPFLSESDIDTVVAIISARVQQTYA